MYKDKDLWSALKKCHVKHTIKALAGQLDAPIVENGENFSVGERSYCRYAYNNDIFIRALKSSIGIKIPYLDYMFSFQP